MAGSTTINEKGFYIKDWYIDPSVSVIEQNDQQVHLEPKVMDLLVYLSQQPGQVFTRDDLLENVWKGVIVSDEALTNAIIKLRKAFNDKAKNPQYIETLPKRGYRLIAKVIPVDPPRDNHSSPSPEIANEVNTTHSRIHPGYFAWTIIALFTVIAVVWVNNKDSAPPLTPAEDSGLSLPDKPSIAVLPFVNTGNEIEHAFFSDGITDDLITDLSKLSGLFVISRNSTFQYKGQSVDVKQVSKTLGVQFILEGSVRRSGDQVRINTQLIDGLTGGQIWAERYDGNLGDVFKLQDKVTGQIIQALALQLNDQDQQQLSISKATTPEAYDEYLKGWEHHWRVNRDDFAQAEIHFKKALELDPSFERAYAALALIYWKSWQQKWHLNSGITVAGWFRANRELDKISHPMPLVHSLRSSMYLYNRRYEQAISEAEEAVRLNPSNATGYIALAEAMGFSGQPQEAINHAKKASRLDPNFPAPYLFVEALAFYDQKQYEKAIHLLSRVIAAKPGFNEALIVLIASYGQKGMLDDANQVLEKLNHQLIQGQLPKLTIDWQKSRWPYREQSDREHFFEGLKKAGVPDW